MTAPMSAFVSQPKTATAKERAEARPLGWRGDPIDGDLGRSAAGGVQRAGFERMVAEVCLGKVGAVCAREVSRFARNSRDWQQLIEMCRVVDTVLIDRRRRSTRPGTATTACCSD